MVNGALVHRGDSPVATTRLSEDEIRRYARHIVLPELGGVGQLRLKAARVLVVGAGGLGSPLLLYLAAAGVGTLGVVDDDRVDLSNLQRQVLFTTEAVGAAEGRCGRRGAARGSTRWSRWSSTAICGSTPPTRASSSRATISSPTAATTWPPGSRSTMPAAPWAGPW